MQTTQHYEDLAKQRQYQEQLEKDRYDHETQNRSLQPQAQLAEERTIQQNQRTYRLQELTDYERSMTEAKRTLLYQQENNRYVKQREK
jgi:hypothetical protein